MHSQPVLVSFMDGETVLGVQVPTTCFNIQLSSEQAVLLLHLARVTTNTTNLKGVSLWL